MKGGVERKINKNFVGFSLMQFESFVLAGVSTVRENKTW